LDKEITTGSHIRPQCPSCEVIEILGCLYRNRKKGNAENVKKFEQFFTNEKFSRKVLYGAIH
jgi:hypothetical protein